MLCYTGVNGPGLNTSGNLVHERVNDTETRDMAGWNVLQLKRAW